MKLLTSQKDELFDLIEETKYLYKTLLVVHYVKGNCVFKKYE